MKCQKCGFVSFDHLSKCTKCRADLTAVRQGLGFSAFKSEPPFLLGTLLVGAGKNDMAITGGGAGEEITDVHFGYDSVPSLPDEVDFEAPAGKPALAAEEELGPNEVGNGELTIELLEADLDDLPGVEGSRAVKGQAKDRY